MQRETRRGSHQQLCPIAILFWDRPRRPRDITSSNRAEVQRYTWGWGTESASGQPSNASALYNFYTRHPRSAKTLSNFPTFQPFSTFIICPYEPKKRQSPVQLLQIVPMFSKHIDTPSSTCNFSKAPKNHQHLLQPSKIIPMHLITIKTLSSSKLHNSIIKSLWRSWALLMAPSQRSHVASIRLAR